MRRKTSPYQVMATQVHALRLAAEDASGLYLDAHKAVKYKAGRVASLGLLARQQPHRKDIRAAWEQARNDFLAAIARANRAYAAWQDAERLADSAWTATQTQAA